MIDQNLNFYDHITKVRTKISKAVGILNRAKHFLSEKVKKQLYFALIHPHLVYGVHIWGAIPNSHLQPLIKLQKRAIRIICNTKWNASTSNLFKKLHIQNIETIYKFQVLCIMYKALNLELPPRIQYRIKPVQHGRNTRQSVMDFTVVRKANRVQNMRLSISGPYFWNVLPFNIRSIVTFKKFKTKLKEYLQEN